MRERSAVGLLLLLLRLSLAAGCGCQLFLAGIIFTLWIWILFDLGSIPISSQTPGSSQRYPHIV